MCGEWFSFHNSASAETKSFSTETKSFSAETKSISTETKAVNTEILQKKPLDPTHKSSLLDL